MAGIRALAVQYVYTRAIGAGDLLVEDTQINSRMTERAIAAVAGD
jgi:hypothetical protein